MDLIAKDYKVLVYNKEKTLLYQAPKTDIYHAISTMLTYLRHNNLLDFANKGSFITTSAPFLKESVTKRYVVDIPIPYTRIIIQKMSKGSIDTDYFMSALNYILGGQHERIYCSASNKN